MPGPGIPPQGGGAFDASNLALDVEELDSGASADTIEKAATDSGSGVETSLQSEHLFQRTVIDSVDYDASTKVPQNAVLLRYNTNGYIIALWQAGSTGSPTGIVFSYSTDGGATWAAPAQVANLDEPFVPAAVINQSTGDIHLVMVKRGTPVMDNTWDVMYQVLTWNGTNWTLSGTTFTIVDATLGVVGYSNASLAVDDNGFLCVAYGRKASGSALLRTILSNVPWDLTNSTDALELTLTADIDIRNKILNVDDVVGRKWLLMVEQNGTFKLYASESILSAVQHDIVWTAQFTYFDSPTEEFDITHIQTPLSGTVGIIQTDGNQVVFRTWVPDPIATPVLGSAVAIEGDAPNPCMYPAIMADDTEFIAVYAREVDTDDHQIIYNRSTGNGATWTTDRHPLDEDSGGNHWAWIKLPPDMLNWDMLAVLFCDTALSPYDVHFGSMAVEIVRTLQEVGTASETVDPLEVQGPDSTSGSEVLVAGEDVGPATDSGSGVETLNQERPIAETGEGDDVVQLADVLTEETATGEDVLRDSPDVASAETAVGAEGLLAGVEKTAADAGTGTEETPVIAPPTVEDVGQGVETFADMNRAISDLVRGLESFSSAPPGLYASIYDNIVAHTEFVTRLATGTWASVSEQANVPYPAQKVYHFRDLAGMDNILFRRQRISARVTWGDLERSIDLGETWTTVLNDCADVAFGPDGVGFAIAAGGDSTVHRVYKSIDKGETWSEVYEDTTIGGGVYTAYQRIAVDPFDNDHVALVGHRESQLADLVFTVSTDGFSTAPTRRSDPIAGFFLYRAMVLVGVDNGRWVWGVTPDFISDIRNKIYTTDDDGVSFDLVFDQRALTTNGPWMSILYNTTNRKLFICHVSSEAAVIKSEDNGSRWTLIDIDFVEDADDQSTTLTVGVSGLQAVALVYEPGTDELFVGTAHDEYPVISAVNPRGGLTWVNLRSNLGIVVSPPGGDDASEVKCSEEGLTSVQPVGEVFGGVTDTGTGTETLENLRSVLETGTGLDEIVDMVKMILETGTATESFDVLHTIADASTAEEALEILNLLSDIGVGAEALDIATKFWLTVRLLMVKGVARLRMEGPAGPPVPGYPPDNPLN